MIGIQDIASFVPQSRVDNLARCEQFHKSRDFISQKIGFVFLPRMDKGMETSDMCVRAFEALQQKTGLDPQMVECVIVCTQNPDGFGLPHTASIVHDKLCLPTDTATLDVSLGCSGYIYCLNLLSSFMAGNGMRTGLLFTADPYSKVLDPQDYVTELLFGDAATCTLVSDDPVYSCMRALFATDGKGHRAIRVSPNTRKLSMDGRGVFNFTMRTVPRHILECLKVNGLRIEEVDLFLLHQASKYIIDNLARQLRLPPEKVPFAAAENGNTVSSSIPLMLQSYIEAGPRTILASGFGVGLSWATSIFRRTAQGER